MLTNLKVSIIQTKFKYLTSKLAIEGIIKEQRRSLLIIF